MGRWADRESDEHRLPEGMQRVGYDADTQRYTYQDEEGSYWEGDDGNRYGRLQRTGESGPLPTDEEREAQDHALKQGNREAYRALLPFALLAIVVLFLLFKFLNSVPASPSVHCDGHSNTYTLHSGDTCWALAEKYGVSLERIKALNPHTDCDKLEVGKQFCVPYHGDEGTGNRS